MAKNFLSQKKINKKNIDLNDFLTRIGNVNVIIFTKKGHILEKLEIKPDCSYFIFTENKKILNSANFKSNLTVFKINFSKNKTDNNYIYKNIKLKKKHIFKNCNKSILIHILFPRKHSRANSISLLNARDF